MRKILFLPCLLCLLMATGCTKSTGVMGWGGDCYSVTTEADKRYYGPAQVEQKAYEEARTFCEGKNASVVIDDFLHTSSWLYRSVKLIFRCVPNDLPKGVSKEDGVKI